MKTTNDEKSERIGTLEGLSPQKQEWVLEIAAQAARQSDVVATLKEFGIGVSLSTLQRFVRKYRLGKVEEAGKDLKESAEGMVKRGGGEAFRKGSIEVVRQHLYDLALDATTLEEAKELYSQLLREEEKLREFDMAERKLALAAEETRLKRIRLRLESRKRHGVEVSVMAEPELVEACEVEELAPTRSEVALGQAEELRGLLGRLEEVINRGGSADEKVCEARSLLGSERKLLAGQSG